MFEKIVWATDGTAGAESALPLVKQLATEGDATIVIAHANELLAGRFGGYPLLADEEDIRARIAAQAEDLRDAGFEVQVESRTSTGEDAPHLIAAIAADVGADLVIAGTTGHTQVGGLFVGSVTQKLPRLLQCPLLIVPVHKPAAV
jgi:nucleotide-binding universal stress UspA family protein